MKIVTLLRNKGQRNFLQSRLVPSWFRLSRFSGRNIESGTETKQSDNESNDAVSDGENLQLDSRHVLKSLIENAATLDIKDPVGDEWSSSVYPTMTKRSQARHSIRPKINPQETSVLLFPGQGVQYVGMGKALLEYEIVKQMFQRASEILRYNLLDLCIHGPKDMLDDTVHCQVAVVVTSLAAVEKLKVDAPEMVENCVATAGFSVGEYAALVFAGAMEFDDAIRLLKIRGEAMQVASDLCSSGMMTVMFRHEAKVKYMCAAAREWCARRGIEDPECCIAIYLFPHCRVIAGHMEALKFIELNAQDFGIRKIKYIPVSGAFHTKLMKPAKEVLKKALETAPFEVPLIPVHSNVDGKPYTSVMQIRSKLAEQLCSPVKWEQIMHIIFERPKETPFPNIYECGPGRTLKTLLKQGNAQAYKSCENVSA